MNSLYNTSGLTGDWLDYWRTLLNKQNPSWGDITASIPKQQRVQWDTNPSEGFGAFTQVASSRKSPYYANWLNDQKNKYYGQYSTMAANNPMLWWTDFLSQINPEYDYNYATPYDRGVKPGQYAPTMWMKR